MRRICSTCVGAVASVLASLANASVPAVPEMVLGQQFLDWIRTGDVQTMYAYLSERRQAEIGIEQLRQSLSTMDRQFGRPQGLQLARVENFSLSCVRRVFATRFERGRGWSTVVTCPEPAGWRVDAYYFQPDLTTHSEYLFRNDLARDIGSDFAYYHCDLEPAPAPGETFNCEGLTTDGAAYQVTLRHVEHGQLEIEGHERLNGPADDLAGWSADASVNSMMEAYSAQRPDTIYAEASAFLREGTTEAEFEDEMRFWHDSVGAVDTIESIERVADRSPVLPAAVAAVTFASGDHGSIEFQFIRGAGEFRLLAVEFGLDREAAAFPALVARNVRDLVRDTFGDPQALARCGLEPLPAFDRLLPCQATLHGRDVELQARLLQGVDANDVSVEIFTADFLANLRARLERYEDLLGWTVDSLTCDEVASDAAQQVSYRDYRCRAVGADGAVQLMAAKVGDAIAVLDVEQVAPNEAADGQSTGQPAG